VMSTDPPIIATTGLIFESHVSTAAMADALRLLRCQFDGCCSADAASVDPNGP
jgi:hypothetical protein